ncbi:MAG: HNH endonuclease [Flavobacteriales bacterium]|nr:HNH endonuclease [Flavobacteriales bacterium]
MTTPINTLWTVLTANIPLQQWLSISTLYDIVEHNFDGFTEDDLAPVTDTNNEPTWHRNLRNALQRRRESQEILYDGNANYRIDKPYVWRMIREAVNSLNGQITYPQIKEYIDNRWADVNSETVTAQIIVLTVNHGSRIHYPENQKLRLTNTNSPYDFLYTTGRGQVVKYDQEEHGVWEIFKNPNNEFAVRQYSEAVNRKTYTPADIVWFKNVTNTTDGEAYLDLNENTFVIHFPTIHRTNVLSPAIDEVILVRQKVNRVPAFTHLVTPIDNELIDEINSPNYREDYRYGRRVKIIARTSRDNFIPVSSTLWERLNFAGITQDNACKIENIANIGNIDELQYDVWQRFNGHFIPTEQLSVTTTAALINELATSYPDLTVTEGELRLVAHLVKERNRKIVREKKQQAISNNTLLCEVCAFSFPDTYQANFIECHHKTPIGQTGVRETTLDDLALVCANCHRMLHAKFDGQFLSIAQLRGRMLSLQTA